MSDEEEDEQPTSKRAKSKNGAPTKTNAKETEPENDVDSDETGDEEEDAVDDMLKALHGGEDDSEQQKRNIDPFLVFPSVQTLLLKETGLGIEGCQSLVKTEVGVNVVSTALMQSLRRRGLTADDIKMTTLERTVHASYAAHRPLAERRRRGAGIGKQHERHEGNIGSQIRGQSIREDREEQSRSRRRNERRASTINSDVFRCQVVFNDCSKRNDEGS